MLMWRTWSSTSRIKFFCLCASVARKQATFTQCGPTLKPHWSHVSVSLLEDNQDNRLSGRCDIYLDTFTCSSVIPVQVSIQVNLEMNHWAVGGPHHASTPANTTHSTNDDSMLDQCLRRWSNIKATLLTGMGRSGQRLLFRVSFRLLVFIRIE